MLLAAAGLLLLHMLLLASAPPVIRHLEVKASGWPTGATPVRVVLLSDLHVENRGDTPARLAATVRQVNGLQPDLVLIAGDFKGDSINLWGRPPFGTRRYDLAHTIAPLAGLRAPLGVVASVGNHDITWQARLGDALAKMGIALLDNQAERRGPLLILAVGDHFSHHSDLPAALASARGLGGWPVVLTHSPDLAPDLPRGFNLMLAGHTHCGQIAPPLIGALQTQSIYGRRYACGVVREGPRTTVIGAGLGTSTVPLRLGASPDLWVIDITP